MSNDPRAHRDATHTFRCYGCRSPLLSCGEATPTLGTRPFRVLVWARALGRLKAYGWVHLASGLVPLGEVDGVLIVGRPQRAHRTGKAPRRADSGLAGTGAPGNTRYRFMGLVRAYCLNCGKRQLIDATADLARALPSAPPIVLTFHHGDTVED